MTEADIPTELEKFAEVAGGLAQWDGEEILVEGCTWQPTGQYHSWLRPVLMNQFGGKPLSDDYKTAQWDSPECQAAFDYFIDLNTKYKVGVDKFMNADADAFAAGKAYFHIDGSYRVGTYKNQIDSFEWGVVPLPMKDGVKRFLRYFLDQWYHREYHWCPAGCQREVSAVLDQRRRDEALDRRGWRPRFYHRR